MEKPVAIIQRAVVVEIKSKVSVVVNGLRHLRHVMYERRPDASPLHG